MEKDLNFLSKWKTASTFKANGRLLQSTLRYLRANTLSESRVSSHCITSGLFWKNNVWNFSLSVLFNLLQDVFLVLSSNLLIWRGNFYLINYYRVSYEPLYWGIFLFNVNWTVRHTTISIKLLLPVFKNKLDFKICVIFASSYTMTIGQVFFHKAMNLHPCWV